MNVEEYEQRFFALLKAMGEFYDKTFSGIVYEMWFNDIRRFDYETVKKAFSIHRQTPISGKFMPKPADIIAILEGTSKDAAFIAWTKVKESISRVGSYESVCFDDPIIHLVIKDLGGWVNLCQSKEEQLKFIAHEFRSRYEGYKLKGEIPIFPRRLAGIHESDNIKNNYLDKIDPPILIGDKISANQVLLGTLPTKISNNLLE